MADWLSWIEAGHRKQAAKRVETVATLKAKIAALERQLAGK
jgi:hydrogenase nickel incorporation protein HypB